MLPRETVQVDVRTRPMSETAAAVTALLTVGGDEAAQIEILVINSPRQAVMEGLAGLARHAV